MRKKYHHDETDVIDRIDGTMIWCEIYGVRMKRLNSGHKALELKYRNCHPEDYPVDETELHISDEGDADIGWAESLRDVRKSIPWLRASSDDCNFKRQGDLGGGTFYVKHPKGRGTVVKIDRDKIVRPGGRGKVRKLGNYVMESTTDLLRRHYADKKRA